MNGANSWLAAVAALFSVSNGDPLNFITTMPRGPSGARGNSGATLV